MDGTRDRALTHRIIGCAFKVHNVLGAGFLEKVYENALVIELRGCGLKVSQQVPLKVMYGDNVVGEYFADLLVEGRILCELKAVRRITTEHEVQLVNYLTATGIDVGLLLNFGSSVEVRKKFLRYQPGTRGRTARLPH